MTPVDTVCAGAFDSDPFDLGPPPKESPVTPEYILEAVDNPMYRESYSMGLYDDLCRVRFREGGLLSPIFSVTFPDTPGEALFSLARDANVEVYTAP